MYYLDYDKSFLDGNVIKSAGYGGVIRYIAAGRESKQTNLTEYRNHLAAGLDVYFVCQAGTSDADQGFNRGAELARAAKAEADYLGYPTNRVIFFTNDRTTLPNPEAWRAFLDGAASVLGRSRVGAYGFANAMDAAQGHAVAFWQAGRRSDVRPFVNFWQDNNTQVTVGGITCDRNLVLVPMPGGGDIVTPQEMDTLVNKIWSKDIWHPSHTGGLPVWQNVVWTNQYVNEMVENIKALSDKVEAIEAKLTDVETPQVDVDDLAAALVRAGLTAGLTVDQVVEAVKRANKDQWSK